MMGSILVIDRDKEQARVASALLSGSGHQVALVSDVESGAEVARRADLDAILLDAGLLENSSPAALDTLRAAARIVLTGVENDAETAACENGAFFACVSKPFEKSSLNTIVGNALSQGRALSSHAPRQSEARLNAILEAAVDGIITIDGEGIIDSFNRAAERMFGYMADEVIGKNIKLLIPEPHRSEHDNYIANYLESGRGKILWRTREEVAMHKDGTLLPIELSISEIKADGTTLFTGIVRDLTERKKAEAEEKARDRHLIHADKMVSLGILVSGVAHEINNPNHLVLLGVDQLSDVWRSTERILDLYYDENGEFDLAGLPYSEVKKDVPDTLSSIRSAAKRIMSIVSELRDYAQEQPSQFVHSLSLNRVVDSATTLLANMIKKSTDRFTLDLDQNLPTVKGNHQHLEQVVINLIQNACQAIPDRGRALLLSTYYEEITDLVVLKVTDEGTGIAHEDLERVTDPFFTTKREQGGTGLGLSISSRIVLEHGGKLEITSSLGQGTTIAMSLPRDRVGIGA